MDLTPVLQAVISLAATVITAMVIPFIKSKTSAQQLTRMQSWARIAVKAAEQLYPKPDSGKDKKAYVLKFLNQHGFTLDAATLDALIESAVNTLSNEQYIIEEDV